jgi:23S rRNA (adenine2030-N6)-methyltransferase
MLAYRHAFHAGNHADVLKHLVLVQLLRHMNRKDKPYRVIDTHAGAGGYALHDPAARKNAEFADGIARLWSRSDAPPAVADYLEQVRAFNPSGALQFYPGSPTLAQRLMRAHDRLWLFELHPTDSRQLLATLGAHPGVQVRCADGFEALKSVLPPPERRAVVLIDPSYELKTDYAAVRRALTAALARFATGTYAVWYPLLQRRESHALPQQLRRIAGQADWVDVRIQVRAPDASGFGLLGSGMFVIHPPWTLHATLRTLLPWLTGALAQDAAARFWLEQQAD